MATPTKSGHPHILLATDRAPGTQEHLMYTTMLANKLGARITLYHAIPTISLVLNAPLAENQSDVADSIDEVRVAMGETAGTMPADRPVHVEVDRAPDPTDAILAAAERVGADIIVLPTQGRTGLTRAVLGSTAEQVMRRATVPVLLLTDSMLAHRTSADSAAGPMIIATDLSPESIDAHETAFALANRLGLTTRLLSVVTDPVTQPVEGDVPIVPKPIDNQPAIDARTRRLHELAKAIDTKERISVEAQCDTKPVDTIIRRAKELHAPLLVMTTHGRRGIQRLLQGSVAEQIVRRAVTPVLVMPRT